jgi:transposase
VQQLKGKAPPVASTTDEARNPNVVKHAEVAEDSIVSHPRWRKQGCDMEAREAKGLAIATNSEIIREGNVWIVPSQTGSKKYTVDLFLQTCTCLDFEENGQKCKHLYAVEFALQSESGIKLPAPPKIVKPSYSQPWHEYNLSQTREKGHFKTLLHDLCGDLEDPIQTMGRPHASMSDIVYSAAWKVYTCDNGRHLMTDLHEAEAKGYISKAPHYNSLFRYLEAEWLTPYLQELITQSALPLRDVETKFAPDSSGFRMKGYVRWFNARYGHEQDNHDWLKLHIMCGVKTNIVAAAEVSERHANDSPFFKLLFRTTARYFDMKEVMADKAYLSRANLRLVASKGAVPYIAFKDNTRGDSKCGVWNTMFHYYSMHREEFNRHYHQRSNVETTFHMIKSKFGEQLRSKTLRAQTNELLCKVLCHNIRCIIQSMYELGIDPTFGAKMPPAPKVS